MAKRKKSTRFVSRGGDKLDGALNDFGLDIANWTAVDLGANVGGFTDCLLQRGAKRVYAVDTGYGVLEWKLRQDDRVVVMERQNALHVHLPELVDMAVVDVGWTSLIFMVPVVLQCIKMGGFVVALLKPQYEAQDDELQKGVVLPEYVDQVVMRVLTALKVMGIVAVDQAVSQIVGSGGNREYFLLFKSV